jgi:hypothetical protein
MSNRSKDQIISNIYYNVEIGYGSIKNTYDQARKEDPTVKLEDVQKWMKQQPNKQRKPYKGYNSYTAPFARFEYQIDIMDMNNLQKLEAQPRYALVVIDIFSKLGEAQPMHNKDSNSVFNALLVIFKKMGYPMSVYSDDDGAFKSKVKEFFDSEGINHIVTLTHANVVERFIRTLKNGVHDRVRFTRGKWEDMIKFVINKYNNSIHSTTNQAPNDAHQDKNAVGVAVNLAVKSVHKRKYKNINVGDDVKIFTKGNGKYASRKETTSKWSEITYKVEKIDRDITLNTYFVLEGLPNRHFNRHELLMVE